MHEQGAPEPKTGRLLAVGTFREDAQRGITAAAAAAGTDTSFVIPDELDEALQGNPLALLVRMDEPSAGAACFQMRRHPRLAGVPILGTSATRGDLAFTELFCWGGDDLVDQSSADALVRRLRTVVTARSAKPCAAALDRGVAVVAAQDRQWRSIMGRALNGGGYAVHFAATCEELDALGPEVKVVVAADDLPGGGAPAAAARARARGLDAVWVVLAPPKRMRTAHRALHPLRLAAAMDSFAPPENVLFVINELVSARGVDQRKSPRILYGTAVAFRQAGRDQDEVGFSYNISAGGLYVRTFAPPESGQEVWIDVWPPRSERRVRLAGKVAWRRMFGDATKTAVPPGFGVELVDGLAGDQDRWRAGYEVLKRTMLGSLG